VGGAVSPPGFSETVLNIAGERACVSSALSDPTAVDPNYLTAYRQCALVEVDESTRSATAALGETCNCLTDLGASGVERAYSAAPEVSRFCVSLSENQMLLFSLSVHPRSAMRRLAV
jgi:hypothetical protein